MRFLICLFMTFVIAYGASLAASFDDCRGVLCTMDLKICPDGTPAPIPKGECCPSFKACKINCTNVSCTADMKICPDGTPAPVPVGECCPSLEACKPSGVDS